jgi:type II secretory pathway pseudopilin PulG
VTLVEMLVSCTIIGLALSLMTGSFSSAVIGARIARNTTAAESITQSEFDRVRAGSYSASFSECFATEGSNAPPPRIIGYKQDCLGYDLYRADMTLGPWPASGTPNPNIQRWTILVQSWPQPAPIVPAVDILKDTR